MQGVPLESGTPDIHLCCLQDTGEPALDGESKRKAGEKCPAYQCTLQVLEWNAGINKSALACSTLHISHLELNGKLCPCYRIPNDVLKIIIGSRLLLNCIMILEYFFLHKPIKFLKNSAQWKPSWYSARQGIHFQEPEVIHYGWQV